MGLTSLPAESCCVIGGGYVRMEQAQLFAGLGAAVTLIGRLAQYVYVAAETGRVASVNALGGKAEVDYTGLPRVLFTRPQASAELTDAQALAAGHACDCRALGAQTSAGR